MISFILLLIVAGICGSIGAGIVGHGHRGCLTSIALGFIGAWIGPWIGSQLHLGEPLTVTIGHEHFPLMWSVIGAGVVVAILSLFTRGRRF